MFRRIAALVLATAGVVVVAVLFMLFSSSPQISFAEVINKVAQTKSVTCKQTITIPGKPAETARMTILADGLSRFEMPDGNYTVMDMKTGNAICVSPHEKKATIMLGLGVVSGLNLYDMFHNIVNETSVRLPDEVIDGRNVNVFRAECSEQVRKQARGPCEPMKVWVDPQTRLPIRMEPMQHKDKESVAIYDFAFDQPVDPSLFSLNPPEGFAVTTVGSTNLPAPPEKAEILAPEVIPGTGLGPVKFGMSKDDIIKAFGKPDAEGKGNLDYPSRGYGFMVSPQRGLVLINCFSQQANAFKVRDFAGKTKEGIGIGSSLDDLEKAFGKPDSVEANGPQTEYVNYNKLGLQLTLFSGKVVTFLMQPPRG